MPHCSKNIANFDIINCSGNSGTWNFSKFYVQRLQYLSNGQCPLDMAYEWYDIEECGLPQPATPTALSKIFLHVVES